MVANVPLLLADVTKLKLCPAAGKKPDAVARFKVPAKLAEPATASWSKVPTVVPATCMSRTALAVCV